MFACGLVLLVVDVGAGLALLQRAGGDDGRLRWDVWPGNSSVRCVGQGSGLLKADGSWGGGTR